jgi:peptidyl-tRNA hydrolase
VGIGRPRDGVDAIDFVLEEFALPEVDQLKELLSRASDAVVSLLQEGGQRAMEQYNRTL